MEKSKLEAIEHYIFTVFSERNVSRLLTKEVFESTRDFANADLVRAFEDLEKRWRLLVRFTNEGHDWIALTSEGATYAGVQMSDELSSALPHPPRSSTVHR